ncbi:aspartate/glutamate racemase family protein [Aureibaculum algae]|uniref:Aspartate/glutamate racemase family protein n=1 Tax=Aureibaculum algae TaxID=2584122 RepID=A0A5B7TYI8_9FLAO|nr:aspartate/glutamate racemase family protein [Aureibaculum algae]QCX40236.1 aspartate/glutamate racemase family protein [Aureibaculum algae]
MKHLVILGLGARSTLFYQKKLHELYFKKEGAYATFPFTLKQLDFNTINPYLPNNTSVLSPILQEELKVYNYSEVRLLVPNITIHEILDTIEFNLQIIHPYKLLVKELSNIKLNNLVFFGTKFTNNNSYLSSYISDKSIVKLKNKEVIFLDDLRKKVYANAETSQDVIIYNEMIARYSINNIVIIACTELSIINTSEHVHVIDLSMLQCKESLKIITRNKSSE